MILKPPVITAVGEIEPPPKEEFNAVPGCKILKGGMPMGESSSEEVPSPNDRSSAPV